MAELFRRILVPHDFSDAANHALRTAAKLAARHRGRVTVLHVVTPFQPVVGIPEVAGWLDEREIVVGARRSLELLVRQVVRGRGAPPVRCEVILGDPHTRIVKAAAKADVIVMATEGRTGLAHLLIGSVAEKVVRHSPVPVLTLRPPTRRGRRRRQ